MKLPLPVVIDIHQFRAFEFNQDLTKGIDLTNAQLIGLTLELFFLICQKKKEHNSQFYQNSQPLV